MSTRRAIELNPYYAEAHNNLGDLMISIDKLSEAELLTRKAIQLKSEYAPAHNNLGIALKEIGEYENSIDSEYIHTLNISYDNWIESISNLSVMTIHTDDFNIFEDTKQFDDIEKKILKRL